MLEDMGYLKLMTPFLSFNWNEKDLYFQKFRDGLIFVFVFSSASAPSPSFRLWQTQVGTCGIPRGKMLTTYVWNFTAAPWCSHSWMVQLRADAISFHLPGTMSEVSKRISEKWLWWTICLHAWAQFFFYHIETAGRSPSSQLHKPADRLLRW